MADDALEGMNIAILVTDGFEQVELIRPRKALDEVGATTNVVSPYFAEKFTELKALMNGSTVIAASLSTSSQLNLMPTE